MAKPGHEGKNGKGGTRTLDRGIIESGRSKKWVVISIACQGASVAIGTTEHNEAAHMLCPNGRRVKCRAVQWRNAKAINSAIG